eukprot:2507527-Rhodomonas_salina.1
MRTQKGVSRPVSGHSVASNGSSRLDFEEVVELCTDLTLDPRTQTLDPSTLTLDPPALRP